MRKIYTVWKENSIYAFDMNEYIELVNKVTGTFKITPIDDYYKMVSLSGHFYDNNNNINHECIIKLIRLMESLILKYNNSKLSDVSVPNNKTEDEPQKKNTKGELNITDNKPVVKQKRGKITVGELDGLNIGGLKNLCDEYEIKRKAIWRRADLLYALQNYVE